MNDIKLAKAMLEDVKKILSKQYLKSLNTDLLYASVYTEAAMESLERIIKNRMFTKEVE